MSKKSGKEALLLWCQKTVASKDLQVKNFTTAFKDGLVFAALVHHYAPDEVGDWAKIVKCSSAQRLKIAFDAAERVGVPPLLDVEDIEEMPKPDQLSVITFVSELYHGLRAHSSGGAGLRAKEVATPAPAPGLAGARAKPTGSTAATADSTAAKSTSPKKLPVPTTPKKPATPAQPASSPGRPCAKCHRPLNALIDGQPSKAVEFEQCHFHQSCFVCDQCGDQLIKDEKADATAEIESVAGRPQCSRCARAASLNHRVRSQSQRIDVPPPKQSLPPEPSTSSSSSQQSAPATPPSQPDLSLLARKKQTPSPPTPVLTTTSASTGNDDGSAPTLPPKKRTPSGAPPLPQKPPRSPAAVEAKLTPKRTRVRTFDPDTLADAIQGGDANSTPGSPASEQQQQAGDGDAAPLEVDSKLLDLEGVLLKKGDAGLLRQWHQRYFVFRDYSLIYYKNETAFKSGVVQGVIPLDDCSACVTPFSEPGRFQINTPTRVWLLQALDDQDALDWMRQIRFRAQQARENVREVHVATGGGQFQGKRRVHHEPYSGWLNMMLGVNRTWKRQWVVAKAGMVLVYPHDHARKPSKKVPLYHSGLREYNPDEPPPNLASDLVGTLKRFVKKSEVIEDFSNTFFVASKSLAVVFQAQDEMEFHQWLNAILRHKVAVEEQIDRISVDWIS